MDNKSKNKITITIGYNSSIEALILSTLWHRVWDLGNEGKIAHPPTVEDLLKNEEVTEILSMVFDLLKKIGQPEDVKLSTGELGKGWSFSPDEIECIMDSCREITYSSYGFNVFLGELNILKNRGIVESGDRELMAKTLLGAGFGSTTSIGMVSSNQDKKDPRDIN